MTRKWINDVLEHLVCMGANDSGVVYRVDREAEAITFSKGSESYTHYARGESSDYAAEAVFSEMLERGWVQPYPLEGVL